jgi:hypothetical protein
VLNPVDGLFDLALTPTTGDRVAVRLRVDAPWRPWLETPVIEAVDACAPPERSHPAPQRVTTVHTENFVLQSVCVSALSLTGGGIQA